MESKLVETDAEALDARRSSVDVAEAISRVLAGDREAFRRLVELHASAVYGLCRRLLHGSHDDAEDAMQETFINAYRYLPGLQDPFRFQPWLYRIARSLCIQRRRRIEVEGRALAQLGERLRQHRLGADSAEEGPVLGALAELPDEERQILHWKYFDALPYEEISRRTGLSRAQVDHLIRKARSRLSRRVAVRQRVETR